jgi:uncharacterized protein YlxP (DUF503 family)
MERGQSTMHLAFVTWDLHLEGCLSLKDKRSRLKPLVTALRRANLSVAEIDHQDLWQRAGLACAAIGSDRSVVEGELRAADRLIEETDGVRVMDSVTVWR